MHTYEKIELETGYTIKVMYSDCYENPREDFCNNTTIYAIKNSRYGIGDKQISREELEVLKESLEMDSKEYRILYMYNHSGISLSIVPFPCKWDSCIAGIVVYNESEKDEKVINEIMAEELQIYNAYLNGEVFEIIVENSEGDIVESIGGFYGNPFSNSSLQDYIDDFKKIYSENSFSLEGEIKTLVDKLKEKGKDHFLKTIKKMLEYEVGK